ncbi:MULTISPECIES: sterol desaturase family protein [Pseudomonas]|uniref:Sterol desaturase family protein n=1 Tax=Pseudomonas nitroreducens TaxID=46680 RepID=A0ABS0KTL2_PSENT|nr:MULTISPECIES: sterol desaturase family protein [Pseudomonas]MBG6291379.1 sterol desaturase family protein [Pseudomonas nitroreducens]NMZ62113.1 sterol desaturase family protein [Pseudomonas nitroreducens]SNT23578.1 Sterol desaturase/sphingolipid hydroxylase, fatty acid hydroxylase superfamily [Pseudomonas nitroreducens]
MPDLPTGLTSWVAAIDPLRDLLLILTPLFIATLLVEWLALRRRGVFRLGDSLASLGLGGLYLVVDAVLVAILVLPVYRLLFEHRLLQFEMTPLAFVLLFFLLEFCFFLFHWASHRIRWFWAAHVVHHSSRHMNFTTAMRQSLFYGFAGNWLFYLPLVWLGFAPEWVLFMLSVSLAYQYFLHTQGVGKLPGAIEWLFNTPSHHRAHHGRNPQYIDRNYGGVLIIYDRLFGTFVEERETPEYGIVRQVESYNPLWLNLHEWVDMFRDLARPGPLRLRLKHLWAPPEWQRPPGTPSSNEAEVSAIAPPASEPGKAPLAHRAAGAPRPDR